MLRLGCLTAAGYRSLRRIRLPADDLSVFVGANGTGKTNLYRALELLQSAASGRLARDLAAEGGFESAFWAGTRQARDPVRIKLGADLRADGHEASVYRYTVEVGLVQRAGRATYGAAFPLEPQIKTEALAQEHGRRRTTVLDRAGPSGFALDGDGRKHSLGTDLLASETALGGFGDGGSFPDLDLVRRTMLDWRFYHQVRTDAGSPLRRPCLAVTAPTLSSDGSDLAAVFATLAHIRQDTADLDAAVADAFPGARLAIPVPGRHASFGMTLPDHPKRVFEASELSDGTLRFLALAGALLAYRLPSFIALNEPEASLHPDLMEPLARTIVTASQRSQIWLVTHSERLADAIEMQVPARPRRVVKREGATTIDGLSLGGDFGEE